MHLAIDLHARFVCAHGAGVLYFLFDDCIGHFDAGRFCDGDDLRINCAHHRQARFAADELVSCQIEQRAKAIEGDVPDNFFPAAIGEVVEHLAGYVAGAEKLGDFFGAGWRWG